MNVLQIYPHGSTDTLPFATMGSGSLAAMAIFESKYREGLSVSWLFIFIFWFIVFFITLDFIASKGEEQRPHPIQNDRNKKTPTNKKKQKIS